MPKELLEVKRERILLNDDTQYLIQGLIPKGASLSVKWKEKDLPFEAEAWNQISALDRFLNLETIKGERISLLIHLPKEIDPYGKLKIYADTPGKKLLWYQIGGRELLERRQKPQVYVEGCQKDPANGYLELQGWIASCSPVEISVEDGRGNPLEARVQRIPRVDVQSLFGECAIEDRAGFRVEVNDCREKELTVLFRSAEGTYRMPQKLTAAAARTDKLKTYWEKGVRHLKTHGAAATMTKVIRKLTGQNKPIVYNDWLKLHLPDEETLKEQRETHFDYEPLFSIVVPLYRTPIPYLMELVGSIREQTYGNWELVLSDGSGSDSPLKDALAALSAMEKRIRVVSNDTPLKIAENTNAALAATKGDYIVFGDHDDLLTANALFENVKAINENRKLDFLYSDEDKTSMDGKRFFEPHMKPDFNPDLLRTVNYICHLVVVSRRLLERVGQIDPAFDGAQDYDFVLRCVEQTKEICHIPKVLYHWRSHENSTAENPESKRYAFEAGKRALEAHFGRLGIPATVEHGEYMGLYRTTYQWEEKPLISIIIPNKDHIDDLKRCVDSLEERASYRNFEIIVVENNSTEAETFAYYRQLEMAYSNLWVVYWKGIFNFSAINNFGAAAAKGTYYLLLNNDTEIINADCLEQMLGYCMRPDVGAVGARLYYEDDTVQHAGVVIGFGGIAGHAFVQQKRGVSGYHHRIISAQDYSAVTAACMMVKKEAYEKVNGLTEELEVAFNDVDFCLKLLKAGYLVVYQPYAELYHYESKSRGLEDTPEKVARFNREIQTFEKYWGYYLQKGDPYYSPNLSLETQDFSLKRLG